MTLGAVDDRAACANAARRLRAWLEARDFAGVEPHDALTSPLMQRTPLGRSRFLRLAALQGLRRLPFDIRPLLGIRPHLNPVSLGWALSAYALLDDDAARERIEWAIAALRESATVGRDANGGPTAGWGYPFDWQTRATFKPANQPIIVSTAFIGLGLLDVFECSGRADCLELARRACGFILTDLNRSPGRVGFCFSYGPDDHEQVFNASMLGAALLARVARHTGEATLMETAREATAFVVDHQRADGSWPYGLAEHWQFIDNFHTGYVLCAIRDVLAATGDESLLEPLERGWQFYRASFLDPDGAPRYYHDRRYPIDAHAAAQTIVTLDAFGDRDAALATARWAIRHMIRRDGSFLYQIHGRYTNRIAYLRWSDVWMWYALVKVLDLRS